MIFLIRDKFFKSIPKEKMKLVIENLKYFYNEIEKNSQNLKNIPKGFWIKKILGGNNLFEFRVNNEDRIFFNLSKRDFEDEKITFLLYSSHDHGIRKSKGAEIKNTEEYKISKNDFIPSDIKELSDDIYLNYNNVITYEIKNDKFFVENTNSKYFYYYLNDEQYKVIVNNPPIFISGSAGSGKSTITLRKILNIEENNEIYSLKNIGYFTGNRYLKDSIEEQYNFFRDNLISKIIEFYTLKEFYKKELGIDSRKIINLKKFKSFLSFSYPNRKKLQIEDNNIYFEIVGIIKGLMSNGEIDNWDRDIDKNMMFFEEYKNLSKKYSILNDEQKNEVYKIALKYEEWKKEQGLYDLNDLALMALKKNKKFDFILVDEIQDLTETEIYFLYNLAKKPENVIFAGDIHQMVSFNSFSFDRLKNLYYKNNIKYSMTSLVKNYRSSKKIVELANYITELRKKYIGNLGTDDYKEASIIDEGNIIISYVDYSFAEKFQNDVNTAIIVSDDEEKEKLSEESGIKHRVFTVDEIKGLEYRDVVCCNLISKNLWAWNKILSGEAKQDQRYRKYFNLFYVGITRAKKNLIIMEENIENNNFLKKIKEFLKLEEKTFKKEEIINNTTFSSKEEWMEEGLKLYKLEKFDEAQYAFEQADYPTWIAEKEVEIDIENGDYKLAISKVENNNFKKNKVYFQKLIIDNLFEKNDYLKILKYLVEFDFSYKYFEVKKKISEKILNNEYEVKEVNKLIPFFLNKKEFTMVGDLYFSIKKYDLAVNFYKKSLNINGIIKARREILKSEFSYVSDLDEKIEKIENLVGKKDINSADKKGNTPLYKAMELEDSEELSEMLIRLGANINEKLDTEYGKISYLHYSVLMAEKDRQDRWMKFFIDHKINIEVESSKKETPLFIAGIIKSQNAINYLLKEGADINHENINNETPIFYHLRERNIKWFKFYAEKLEDISRKNKKSQSIEDIINEMKKSYENQLKESRQLSLIYKIYKRYLDKIV